MIKYRFSERLRVCIYIYVFFLTQNVLESELRRLLEKKRTRRNGENADGTKEKVAQRKHGETTARMRRENRVSKKEMRNVINTMHHTAATQSGKWVARLFIAQEIGKS